MGNVGEDLLNYMKVFIEVVAKMDNIISKLQYFKHALHVEPHVFA